MTATILLSMLPIGSMAEGFASDSDEVLAEPLPFAEEQPPEQKEQEDPIPSPEETEPTEETEHETSELPIDDETEALADVLEISAANEQNSNSTEYYMYYNEELQIYEQQPLPGDAIRFSTLGQVDEIGAYQTQTCYVLDCDYIHRETSLYIKGDVSLILMNGCRMEVFSVRVDYPFSIRIYSQAGSTGTLIANNDWHHYGHGENGCAGIGGSSFGVRDSVYDYNAGEIYIRRKHHCQRRTQSSRNRRFGHVEE